MIAAPAHTIRQSILIGKSQLYWPVIFPHAGKYLAKLQSLITKVTTIILVIRAGKGSIKEIHKKKNQAYIIF